MMARQDTVDVVGLLTKLAEAQHKAELGELDPRELPGLVRAQRLVREYAGWPVEADSDR
ncbi:hypothetical protein SAMN05421810_101295 [Amycolatopsis arida]|uniref:Uncharacterized protein n=1 Tax=Amycolatopsis arida TaxID=587909 RepID=A0A1I5KU43_9PSEU|nr:hypothetical protein [Amycolatopsis arida]TDX85841.1 hypothetical protein CLV69_11420 [Amycolatopsis arida]SFO88527.1 hypothetical protein SAMN05421810_101295 [Amycolatopsis arida]